MASSSPATGGSPAPLRYLPLSYNNSNPDESAIRLVYEIEPKWREEGPTEITRFTDGITNTLLKLVNKVPGGTAQQEDENAILMRAYGNNTDILIDRNREAKSHALLAERGLASPLLARFENGLLYKFIIGRVCTPKDLIRELVWKPVARRLGEWHGSLPINAAPDSEALMNGNNGINSVHSGSRLNGNHVSMKPPNAIAARLPTPNIWTVMRKWMNALPTTNEVEKKRKIQLQKELDRSFEELDSTTGLGEDGLVFGHCDLLSANIIMLPSVRKSASAAEPESVSFIDYEYSTPCPAAFDIANHFAEWGGFDCDYNMLPTRSVRRKFLQEYLQSYAAHSGQDTGPPMLDRLMADVDRYRGMPGFYWGIWALIQATISEIDFDYASYAQVRLGEYWAWRGEVDGTRKRAGNEMPLRERRWAQEA